MHTETGKLQGKRTHVRFPNVSPQLPLLVYAVLYLITCYIGALALLFSPIFRTIYLVFSGADVPPLDASTLARVIVLLHLGPLCIWLGYRFALRLAPPTRGQSTGVARRQISGPRIVFAFAVLAACVSFTRTHTWGAFGSWLDYNAYIHARIHLFDELTFFEFVNLYALLPVAAAYLCLTERRRLYAAVAVGMTLALQTGLAQRRVLLVTVIFIGAAIYLYRFAGSRPRAVAPRSAHGRIAVSAGVALYAFYAALTVTTVLRPESRPFDQIQQAAARTPRTHAPDEWVRFTPDPDAAERIQRVRWQAITLYVLFSPLTRTSISAIAYPAVFPQLLPFYSIDLGQDILGFGGMPDDNIKVYSVLWPQHKQGAIAAPAQFAFYSQGGVLVAFACTVLVGALLALLWTVAVLRETILPHHALCGAVVIVLAMGLTMDSARNVFIVSYGVVWEFASIAVLAASARCTAFASVASAQLTGAR
jgi:hypothetical protein